MTVLVTGGRGMLGHALGRALGERAVLADRRRCDVRDTGAVADALDEIRPTTVIHAAAWTDVDGCEEDEARAHAVNVFGTRVVAEAAAARGIRMILTSTDYVFSGSDARTPLTEDAPTGPLSAYGRTKLAAEETALERRPEVAIVRLSATYGPGGRHFAGAILKQVSAGNPLRVVEDQTVSPSYVDDVAGAIAAAGCRCSAASTSTASR